VHYSSVDGVLHCASNSAPTDGTITLSNLISRLTYFERLSFFPSCRHAVLQPLSRVHTGDYSRRFRRLLPNSVGDGKIVAVSDYSRQCGQGFTHVTEIEFS